MADIDQSISTFKTRVVNNGGFQRNNRFVVQIVANDINDIFGLNVGADGAPAEYIAETVILPSTVILTQADSLSGPGFGRTSPRGVIYKDGVLITFPVFGNWKLVDGVTRWARQLYYPSDSEAADGRWSTNYYVNDNYSIGNCSVNVSALDLNGNKKYTYNFTEAFPVEIFPMQFSSLSNNEILKYTVRFAFRSYQFYPNTQ